jgi:hypothetical protein
MGERGNVSQEKKREGGGKRKRGEGSKERREGRKRKKKEERRRIREIMRACELEHLVRTQPFLLTNEGGREKRRVDGDWNGDVASGNPSQLAPPCAWEDDVVGDIRDVVFPVGAGVSGE